ncbi:D-alanyl-D-alanine carboxypeptidase family protein [Reyranella sp.]|uniref:D-alanyl-D-alanine carboxypeptidase family protein n=1 Tax=Reyranella sp. TaxID=1929291 RepID=UPI00262B6923|nr:D-alanyl-D-alanine carboxypeptidase family protein [Reyranella sp.]HQS17886.1 D-alanyl-D-alanine carboxypeptidase family protein [Reyranella sp.]HQT10677.1 D-alanyl-D-alanine carboxypeptidase family protein [Reyranella sp.]
MKRAVPPAKARAKAASRNTSSSWVANPGVTAKDAYLIVDATSGRELASDRADELRHPASVTKLMTIYLTFSALDSGRLSLGDALPVSVNALNAPPTKMGMTPGGTVNVRDATMALVTRSANDAAVLLAEGLAGTEEAFARLMTQKARQLGMSSTVFRNASGLPNSEQVTTARDLAKLANALMRDYPHYYAIFSVQSYAYRGRTLENHNRMLGKYDGADGLKTGYTNASGFNLVMSAVRDNRRLIGVVMGGTSAAQRDRTMAALMDRGFALAQAMQLSPWTSVRKPPSARYTAAQFDPGASFAEAYRPPATPSKQVSPKYAGFVPPARATPTAPAAFTAAPPAAADMPTLGSWVIQVGSFSEPQAAQAALERATAALPDARSASAIVDEVQMANRVFHRARLINLSQDQAVEGCKRLEKRKVYCAALQVTAWNTPGAR